MAAFTSQSTNKTLVLEEPYKFVFSENEIPAPGAGQALVRVGFVGVCGTDFHAYHGRQNFFSYPRNFCAF